MVRSGGLLALAGVSLLIAFGAAVALPDPEEGPNRLEVASFSVPPVGVSKSVAWVGDSLVLQHYSLLPGDRGFIYSSRLWELDLDSGRTEELPTPYNGACESGPYMFESPVRFGDGLLGYVQVCSNRDPEGKPTINLVYRLRFMDLDTLEMSSPVDPADPLEVWLGESEVDIKIDGLAIDFDRDRLLVTDTRSSRSLRIMNFDSATAGSPVVGLDQVWSLSAGPGGRVAFVGRHDKDRTPPVLGKSSLYVSNIDLREPTIELVPDVEGMIGTGWSADGKYIAFGGGYRGTEGLYVVEVETRKVQLIARGEYSPNPSSWAPTGHRIAVIDDSDLPRQTIRIFDVELLERP